jgi:small subunit ribosomal protein S24e
MEGIEIGMRVELLVKAVSNTLDGSLRIWMMLFVCDDDAHSLFFFSLQENSAPVTIRTRKFTTNRLLSRRQFIVDVLHSSRPPISRADLSEKLGAIYKVDKARVVPFGFKTLFGGGRSTGFALIYDSLEAQKKFEPRYRLVRVSAPLFVPCQSFSLMPHRLAFHPRWRRLPVNCARSERIVQRRYVYLHLSR